MNSNSLTQGLVDLRAGFADWHVWSYLSWRDLRQRYRRSRLGPLWVTLSMAIHITGLGIVWGALFGLSPREFVPHLCAGLMIWNLIQANVNDGCDTFIGATHFITQISRPLSVYALWVLCRNLLSFVHTLPVYLAVVLIFRVWPNQNTLSILIGFPLLILAVSWPPFLLGLFTARYRDVQQIVQSVMALVFLVTPILWRLDQLGSRRYLATLNPFTHVIEIVRAPLLGQPISTLSLAVSAAVACLGWIVTLIVFGKYRGRIAYWL